MLKNREAPSKVGSMLLLLLIVAATITPLLIAKSADNNYTYKIQWMNPDPYFIDSDASGNIYIAGRNTNTVYKYDSQGNQLKTWGGPGSGDGKFNDPEGIAVDSVHGYVYLTDYNNNRVQKFDTNGIFISKWGSVGSGDGQFVNPAGIAVDILGNVYVTDQGHNRVEKFSADGVFITKFGSGGTGNGEFNSPESIAVDSHGNIYVGDEENNRVQKFDSNGHFLSILAPTGTGQGQVIDPEDVAVDVSDNVYIADSDNSRIQKFDPSGTFVDKWGSTGSGEGQFNDPRGVAVDFSGNVYVADTGNSRIQKFVFNIGVLLVTVKDPSGNKLAGVIISSITAPTGQSVLKGTSNSSGIIVFKDILPGGYTLMATKTGYVNMTSSALTVTAGGTLSTTLTLTPEAPTIGNLKTTVKDPKGTPIVGASVSATTVPSGQSPITSMTALDGTLFFSGVKTGSYTLQASKNGYITATTTVTVIAGSSVEVIMTLNPETPTKGSLQITLSDSKSPIKGATVTLPSEASSTSVLTTGEDGTVTFSDVNPGSYSVKITMAGYVTVTQTMTVSAGGAAVANVIMQTEAPPIGSIKITVKDQDGHTLGGVDVSSESQPEGIQPISGSTNNDGVAVFTGVAQGGYMIDAKKSGYTQIGGGVGANVVSGSVVEVTITLTAQQAQGGASMFTYEIAAGVIILLVLALLFLSRTRKQLKLIYGFGFNGKNTLDTFTETFTWDTATGINTMKMKLTSSELNEIKAKLEEIGFFDKTDSQLLPSGNVIETRTPFESYYLKAKLGDRVRELRWSNKAIYDGDSSKKLEEVNVLMSKIIESARARAHA